MSFIEHPDPVLRRRADQAVIGSEEHAAHHIVVPGSTTGGEVGLFDITLAPRSPGAAVHYHPELTETFYVLSGRMDILGGDTWHSTSSGDAIFVPRGGVHAFRNDTDDPVRFLLVFTPGAAREEYFTEMAALHERDTPPTMAEIDEIAARHGQVNVR